ncbi:MAG TPA: PBP1A family penicillin-binding protein [Actinomycetota bacterium]|nr:PBP1A family penicillin-binding protein [Actinomycetota bacterium]
MSPSSPRPVARLLGAVVGLAMLSTACGALPDLKDVERQAPPLAQTSKIYDAEGRLITTLHAEEDRVLVPIDRIPRSAQKAVIAIEDQRFWTHRGIDLKALLRAAYVNATQGAVVEGGSTITQQYVKNRLVGSAQTLDRKVREAALAWQLEEKYSKEEILERYLNTVYFGNGAYGIQRAARTYFSVRAAELSLPQAALLAGLIAGPERYDPLDRPKRALVRRNVVLDRMLDLGMVRPERHARALRSPLRLDPSRERNQYAAAYFVDYVKRAILTNERFGETYQDRYDFLFRGGLRIYTTIDLDMQRAAENAVNGILSQPGDPYGALTAIDPRNGHIKAMVGGRDYWVPRREDRYSKVNLAAGGSTGRQAGSAFKPFALVAALESGIPPSKTYSASPNIVLAEPPCGRPEEPWDVENYEGSGYGTVTIEQATVASINVVYAQIIRDVGPESVVEVARRMGIRSKLRPYCSAVLGTNEVNTVEMASAYGTLARNGKNVRPTPIRLITDADGDVVYRHKPKRKQVVNPAVAWLTTQILRKVVLYGTGTAANIGRPQAGKTGTAQEWRDAWFAGFLPQLSAAVWVGWPQGQISMTGTRIGNVTGGSFPAQIWHAFMAEATQGMRVLDFKSPDQAYVTLPVDTARGCVLTPGTSPVGGVDYQNFLPGQLPPECPSISPPAAVVGVPSVVGMNASSAYDVLAAAGFAVTQTVQETEAYPAGTVLSQSPPAGTEAPPGTTVTLVVASG